MRARTIQLGCLALVMAVCAAARAQDLGSSPSGAADAPAAGPADCGGAGSASAVTMGAALGHFVRGRILMAEGQHALAAKELAAAAEAAPGVARVWRHLGYARYQAGDIAGGVKALDEALRLQPDDAPSLYLRGRAARMARDADEALGYFERLLEGKPKGDPHRVLALYYLARAYQERGDVDRAIEFHEPLVEELRHPQPAFRRYNEVYFLLRGRLRIEYGLAGLYLLRGRNDEAIDLLEAGLAERPDNPETLALLCRANLQSKDFEAARRWARRLVQAHPTKNDGYVRLIEAYQAEGRPEGAVAELETYHRAMPDNSAVAFELGKMYESLGRGDEAADLYGHLVESGAEAAAQAKVAAAIKLAELHLGRNEPVKAIEALAAGITSDRMGAAVLMRAARLIDELDDRQAVYDEAQRLVTDETREHGPFVLVGMLAEGLGRRDDAVRLYDQALDREPKAGICYSRKAELLIQADRLEEALGVYQTAVDRGLELPAFRRKMGMILERLDRTEEAVREYRAVLTAVPQDRPTRYLLAGALLELGQLDEAERELKDLAIRFPDDLQAYTQLANLYVRRNDIPAAEAAIEKALSLDADAVMPRAVLAEIRFRQKRHEEAERIAREILADHPGERQVQVLLAYSLAGMERFQEAVDQLQNLLGADPANLRWRYLLSGIYTEMGDSPAAERELLHILDDHPEYGPANNDLGYLWAERGVNLARAESMIRKALEAEPENPAYLDSMGWVLYKRGRFEEALEALQSAAGLAPEYDAVVWDHLGDTLWRLSRRDEAGEAWQKAIAILESRSSGKEDDLRRVRDKVLHLQEGAPPQVSPLGAQDELEDDESASKSAS